MSSIWKRDIPLRRMRTPIHFASEAERASKWCAPAKEKGRRLASFFFGWGTGIRTPVMSESESDALPLGDAPISQQALLYHIILRLSIPFSHFFILFFSLFFSFPI